MEKGLYKIENGGLMYAQISVNYANGDILTVADYENAVGEVYDGWYWFNTRQEAMNYFGITEVVNNFIGAQ